jgi:Fe-S oxidoreductase
MTDTVTFWYGCNVVRHGDIIRASIALLEAIGIRVRAAGGAAYCCGTAKDANLRAAEGMATRTVEKFNALGHEVVTWCPSCHMHMEHFMQHEVPRAFDLAHITERLHRHRDRLAPLLTHAQPQRVLIHRHLGFREVPAADRVADLLRLIPQMQVLEAEHVAPAHMCSSLARVPEAQREANRALVALARAERADTVVTVYHSCQRLLCGLAADEPFGVINYVSLLTRAMGLDFADEYTEWKLAGSDEALIERIGPERLARAGEGFVQSEILPELRTKPRR